MLGLPAIWQDFVQKPVSAGGDTCFRQHNEFITLCRVALAKGVVFGHGLLKIMLTLGIIDVDFRPRWREENEFVIAVGRSQPGHVIGNRAGWL